jgi:D-sedoheptulose 7-phosphate isomerase
MLAHTLTPDIPTLAGTIGRLFAERNRISRELFPREAERLALACREMADRFARGGRLLACGRGPYATDAQHVAVEFVHPVIVGKRALPALDLSIAPRALTATLLRADDIVMGFGPPDGDGEIASVLRDAHAAGAQTLALPGEQASYALASPAADPFVHQEMIEILYHTLWETVHVYLEMGRSKDRPLPPGDSLQTVSHRQPVGDGLQGVPHREAGHDLGAAGFLYPFLGEAKQDTSALVGEVAASICAKAAVDEQLRDDVAATEGAAIARAAVAMHGRIAAGGTVILFGNGGSATDANDFALDCVMPPKPGPSIRALSLAMDPANLTAIANDIGRDAIFLRQLIAHGRPGDIAVAISTSGGSTNVVAALEEARKRGMLTVALLGYDGGEIVRRGLADVPVVVRCDYIPRIQEVQASIYHVLIDLLHLLHPHGHS